MTKNITFFYKNNTGREYQNIFEFSTVGLVKVTLDREFYQLFSEKFDAEMKHVSLQKEKVEYPFEKEINRTYQKASDNQGDAEIFSANLYDDKLVKNLTDFANWLFRYFSLEIYVKNEKDKELLKTHLGFNTILEAEKVVLDQIVGTLKVADAQYKNQGKTFWMIERPYERNIAVRNLIDRIKKSFYEESSLSYQISGAKESAVSPTLRAVKAILEEVKVIKGSHAKDNLSATLKITSSRLAKELDEAASALVSKNLITQEQLNEIKNTVEKAPVVEENEENTGGCRII